MAASSAKAHPSAHCSTAEPLHGHPRCGTGAITHRGCFTITCSAVGQRCFSIWVARPARSVGGRDAFGKERLSGGNGAAPAVLVAAVMRHRPSSGPRSVAKLRAAGRGAAELAFGATYVRRAAQRLHPRQRSVGQARAFPRSTYEAIACDPDRRPSPMVATVLCTRRRRQAARRSKDSRRTCRSCAPA